MILDLEAGRPGLGLCDTETALSSLLPLHSLTTGYDAAFSGARPDSHRSHRGKHRDGRPEEEVGKEGVRKIKRSWACVETCCLQL